MIRGAMKYLIFVFIIVAVFNLARLLARLLSCRHYWQAGELEGNSPHPKAFTWHHGAGKLYEPYYCVRCKRAEAFIESPN